jgi:hypothetical protein
MTDSKIESAKKLLANGVPPRSVRGVVSQPQWPHKFYVVFQRLTPMPH